MPADLCAGQVIGMRHRRPCGASGLPPPRTPSPPVSSHRIGINDYRRFLIPLSGRTDLCRRKPRCPARPTVSHSNPLDLRKIGRILRRHPRIVCRDARSLLVCACAGFLSRRQPQYTGTANPCLIDPRHADVTGTNDKSVLPNFGTDDATIEKPGSAHPIGPRPCSGWWII